MFFITGHPRGATKYICYVLRRLGLEVGHEADNPSHGRDGDVSFVFRTGEDGDIGYPIRYVLENYDIVLHQVRSPINVISSMLIEGINLFHRMIDLVGYPNARYFKGHGNRYLSKVWWGMYTWYHWNLRCERAASLTYRVEDLDHVFPELCRCINIAPVPLPDVPRNTNTRPRRDDRGYHKITYQQMAHLDADLADKIVDLAVHYGYKREEIMK